MRVRTWTSTLFEETRTYAFEPLDSQSAVSFGYPWYVRFERGLECADRRILFDEARHNNSAAGDVADLRQARELAPQLGPGRVNRFQSRTTVQAEPFKQPGLDGIQCVHMGRTVFRVGCGRRRGRVPPTPAAVRPPDPVATS